MKYVLIATMMLMSSLAFAYHSSTVGNEPTREPSSVPETKQVKPSK